MRFMGHLPDLLEGINLHKPQLQAGKKRVLKEVKLQAGFNAGLGSQKD